MVAMKAASEQRREKIIEELQLVYNKTRQAGITKEISEIVAAPRRSPRSRRVGCGNDAEREAERVLRRRGVKTGL